MAQAILWTFSAIIGPCSEPSQYVIEFYYEVNCFAFVWSNALSWQVLSLQNSQSANNRQRQFLYRTNTPLLPADLLEFFLSANELHSAVV